MEGLSPAKCNYRTGKRSFDSEVNVFVQPQFKCCL